MYRQLSLEFPHRSNGQASFNEFNIQIKRQVLKYGGAEEQNDT